MPILSSRFRPHSRYGAFSPATTFLLLFIAGVGCRSDADRDDLAANGAGNDKLSVVATTGPVADLVRQIGGERVQVEALMGPGVDPHLYRAVPSDIAKLQAADLIVYNGLHLEGRMIELLENLEKSRKVIAVTEPLVDAKDKRLRKPTDYAGQFDPHVWHDPLIWADCAAYVADEFSALDPENENAYQAAANKYQADLRQADEFIRELFSSFPEKQRVLVSAHDAFYYFGNRYGLTNVPLRGVSTDDKIDMARLGEVIEFLVKNKVRAVFVETSVAPKVVESLIEPCSAKGWEVRIGGQLYADALGPEDSGAASVADMLRTNAETIVSALRESSSE